MKLKIFVIDDEECIRDSLKWHLEDLGHEVITAPEPTACEVYQNHICSQQAPCGDALIIDNNMPKMTGLEFIELMAQRDCKGIQSNKLLMSGDTSKICIKTIQEFGCSFIKKPLSFDALDAWLKGIIERNKLGSSIRIRAVHF